MAGQSYNDFLAGFDLSYGMRMPGVGSVFVEHADGSLGLAADASPLDRRLLRRRLRCLREALGDGQGIEAARATAEARHEALTRQLERDLRSVYRQTRPIEAVWRGLGVFFEEAEPDGKEIPVWFWNGDSPKWVKVMRDLDPTFVLVPGCDEPPDELDEWNGTYPQPILFGDRELPAYDQPVGSKGHREETSTGPGRPDDHQTLPSRYAACVNELEGRAAYPWEDEPLWVRPSFAVAGVQVHHWRGGYWRSTGAGHWTGRLQHARKTRVRMQVTQAVTLHEAGYAAITEDGRGVMAIGDRTFPLPGHHPAGLGALKLEAAVTRIVCQRFAARARKATPGPGPGLDPRQEAEAVLHDFKLHRVLDDYSIRRPLGAGPEVPMEMTLTVDGVSASSWLIRRTREEVVSRSRADRLPMPERLEAAALRPEPVAVGAPATAPATKLRERPQPPPRTDLGGIGEFFSSLFGQMFRGRDRKR